MATAAITISHLPYAENRDCWVATWAALANGDAGAPIEMPGASDRSIQLGGTFGTGGTIIWEGSNDNVTYFPLTDPQGNAISKTSAGLEQIEEATRYQRPRVSAGDGTTAISVTLFLRRR